MLGNAAKKVVSALVAGVVACALCSCGARAANDGGQEAAQDKPVVYATFFPVYDLTKRIAGDKMDVRTVIKGNQEPHDFELQADEMAKISQADLIVYNGAGMEGFIDGLKDAAEDEDRFLDLSQGLTLLESKDADLGDRSSVNPHT